MTDRGAEPSTPPIASAPVPDDRSFAAFYAASADQLHRALRSSVADPTLAREAVDEAMARAYARWRVVGAYDAPAGWVYRTAMNWSISRWRSLRRERSLHDEVGGPDPSGDAEVDPEGALALEALRRLPIDQRSVVVCRVVLDLDTRGTATALGIAEGTVKSRLSRGLDALRATLEVQQ